MIFEESLPAFQSMGVMILVAVGIFIWRFYLFKNRHLNKLTKIPSVIVLGPKSSGKTSLIKKLTKNKVLSDPIADSLNISYLKDENKKFQIVDGTPRNIKQFKKLNYKSIIYVFDPSPNSISIKEQIKDFEKVKKSFKDAKFFCVINKADISDGKKLNRIKNKTTRFYIISAKTGDGLGELKGDILSLT